MNLIIAAGGTGGHLFPGIAVAERLKVLDPAGSVTFVGGGRGVEGEILRGAGFSHEVLPVARLRLKGEGWGGRLRTMVLLPFVLLMAMRRLKERRADVVFGTGGYGSGPVILAALLNRVPRAILEPNAIPGFTNRILGRWVDRIFIAFPETGRFFPKKKTMLTGTPVRSFFTTVEKERQPSSFTILLLGGSQGASALNRALVALLPTLKESGRIFRIIHQTGVQDHEWVRSAYKASGVSHEVRDFIQEMASAYGQADLVIGRAGASTIAELAETQTPSILVPYPKAADDHQRGNALSLVRAGGAEIVPENGGDFEGRLRERIFFYERNPKELERMRENLRARRRLPAAEVVAKECLKLAK